MTYHSQLNITSTIMIITDPYCSSINSRKITAALCVETNFLLHKFDTMYAIENRLFAISDMAK